MPTGDQAVGGRDSAKCSCRRCCTCFFFQAEDGIRDVAVTGVQTCALPISLAIAVAWSSAALATDVELRAPDKVPDKPSGNVVFLDGAALEELQTTNPNH